MRITLLAFCLFFVASDAVSQKKLTVTEQQYDPLTEEWRPISSYLYIWKNDQGGIDSVYGLVPGSGITKYYDWHHITAHVRSIPQIDNLARDLREYGLHGMLAGRIVSSSFYGLDTVDYRVDSAGFIDSFLVYFKSGNSIWRWSYDAYGAASGYTISDEDGEPHEGFRKHRERDINGRVTKSISVYWIRSDSAISDSVIYTYDIEGKLATAKRFTPNDTSTRYYLTIYDGWHWFEPEYKVFYEGNAVGGIGMKGYTSFRMPRRTDSLIPAIRFTQQVDDKRRQISTLREWPEGGSELNQFTYYPSGDHHEHRRTRTTTDNTTVSQSYHDNTYDSDQRLLISISDAGQSHQIKRVFTHAEPASVEASPHEPTPISSYIELDCAHQNRIRIYTLLGASLVDAYTSECRYQASTLPRGVYFAQVNDQPMLKLLVP